VNLLRYLFNSKLLAALAGVFAIGFMGFSLATASAAVAALPQDCDTSNFHNSIISCGFQDQNGFKAKYNENAKGDVQTLYADPAFNFKSTDMDRFMSEFKWATAYKTGNLQLDDGRVVATNIWSLGHEHFNDQRQPVTLGGHNYFWSYVQYGFHADSIRALVLMDKQDKYMQFAVLTSCGNPLGGTKPTFQCDMLHKNQKSDTDFEFWTDITAKDGATVKNVHYDFGDGMTTNTTNGAQHITYSYKKPGTYHVTVTVTYNVNGHDQTETVQAKCKADVEVKEKPVFACSTLIGTPVIVNGSNSRTKFDFTVRGTGTHTTLQSATFDFGDQQSATVNATAGKDEISTPHEFAKEGDYKITATLTYDAGTTQVVENCTTTTTVKPPTCVDTPNKSECQPCVVNPQASICHHVLPATGPTEILGATVGLSGIAGAGMYYRATRRNFINQLLNKR